MEDVRHHSRGRLEPDHVGQAERVMLVYRVVIGYGFRDIQRIFKVYPGVIVGNITITVNAPLLPPAVLDDPGPVAWCRGEEIVPAEPVVPSNDGYIVVGVVVARVVIASGYLVEEGRIVIHGGVNRTIFHQRLFCLVS